MAAPRRYIDYLKAAFHAKPAGMFVAPNWIGIGLFGMLGFLNPGFWLVGAGVEAAYLFFTANHPRFRRVVDASARAGAPGAGYARRISALRAGLTPEDDGRYRDFNAKPCRRICP